jgi:hypothetical protein
MKALYFVFLALCLTGCASRYSSDPRAAVVGPAYLDFIAEYPRDRDTQYYYPGFSIRDFQLPTALSIPMPSVASPRVAVLLAGVPEPSQKVKDITGKGYPRLERTGLLLFTGPAQ